MNPLQLLDILKLGESEDLECKKSKNLKMKFLNRYGIHIQQWLIQTGVLYY